MRAFKSLLATALVLAVTSSARADLTIDSFGAISLGNSWNADNVLVNTGGFSFDLLTAEVTNDTFEQPVALNTPATGWTGTLQSPAVTFAEGSAFMGQFDLNLVFNGTPMDNVGVIFSAFRPGQDTAFGSVGMVYSSAAGGFVQAFGASTSLTRGALGSVAAPVPGAVLLGAMGLGMVGVVTKRLI